MIDVAERSDAGPAQSACRGYGIGYLYKPQILLVPCFLWFGVQPLEECRDRDDLDRLDAVKAQEIVISADNPAHPCRYCTSDEFRIVRVANLGNGCVEGFD